MTAILVFLQNDQAKILKGSLSALTAAQKLKAAWKKDAIHAVLIGPKSEDAAKEALQYGFSQVHYSDDALFEKFRAEPYSRAVALAAKASGADCVVACATSFGKDLMPRVSVLLDGAQASDVIAVNEDGSLKRPMFAGNTIADVEILTNVKLVTVRSTGFEAAVPGGTSGAVSKLDLSKDAELKEQARFGEVTGYEVSKADRPELTEARVVVSGGRALQSKESFDKIMTPLADSLGAAIGASRAAVDSGYAPNDWQVGQTGKVVAPQLYIAVGISGAIQHLAGMKDSKTIVAINKDPDAPIYEVADFGLVADLYQVVPELTEKIKKVKS